MATTIPGVNSMVLVVDDEQMVLNAMSRFLGRFFSQVFTARTPDEAESTLRNNAITHLVCDHWLGPGLPLGTDLAPAWRKAFPSIRKIVLLTGSDLDTLGPTPDLDTVFPKTIDPCTLTAELRKPH